MKTKQIIGIVVAGLVFVFICVSSALTQKFLGTTTKGMFDDILESTEEGLNTPDGDYVGLLKVEGTMQDTGETSSLFSDTGYNHRGLLDTIEEYKDDTYNKGILLYVNSPGGTVNAADELYLKLMEYKEKTKRPIYVYMADQACSGGYYVSVAGDKIYGNRNTWTGSIGVYMELANYKELMDKLGIKTTYVKAGKNKTMGSATQDLTEEQEAILQSLVDESYNQFVEVIKTGRPKLTEEEVITAADGRIYSATQAKEIGLIDDVKTYEEVKKIIKTEVGKDIEIYEGDESPETIWDMLSASIKAIIDFKDEEKSETEKVLEYIENNESGVPMYYAMPKQ